MTDRASLLLYSLNYSPELTGIGKYNGEMIKWFADADIHTEVVCATPYYPEWKTHQGYKNFYSTEKDALTRVTRCPHYVPSNPGTLKRLMHLASFALSSLFPLLFACMRRPKVMMVVQPTLFCAPMALLLGKLFGIRTIMHIQDFEVDAMFGLSMGTSQRGALARIAFWCERFLLRRFDAISTISHSMLARAASKGAAADQLLFFPNWSDTDFVHPGVSGAALRQEWNVADDERILLYAGNIGAKQGLELLLDAASRLANDPKIRIFIVGTGAHKSVLQAEAHKRHLSNVEFKPLLPWERVPEMLSAADVHLVIQRKGAADAVLPSKLTNILSAGGHTVVTAEADTELGRIAATHPGIYSCVEPEDVGAFLAGLEHELEQASRSPTNTVARQYAETNLNEDAVLARFRSQLAMLCEGKPVLPKERQ